MTVETPAQDVVAVQMLRAVAATMVVFVHIDSHLATLNLPRLGSAWMAAGVDIFFVISGFIMWTSVERRAGMSAWAFLKNRLIRIVPLYWVVTTAVLLIALVAPQLLKSTIIVPAHVVASYLFLPARHPVLGFFWPLVIPGWSLNYEMLFYLVFAIAIGLAREARALRFMLITAMLGMILIVAALTKSSIDVMNFYANPMLLEFIAGMVLGVAWRLALVRPSRLWALATAFGFILLWADLHFHLGFATELLAAAIIVAGAVFLPPLHHNPVSAIGDASYSLYLTHPICVAAVTIVWIKLPLALDWRLYVAASFVLAVAVSIATYNWFEAPVTRALKRFASSRAAASGPVAPRASAEAGL